MLPIDSNIPIPEFKVGRRPDQYPWADLKIGDSFFVAAPPTPNIVSGSRKTGFKFLLRKVTEQGVHGNRVWRIA